MTIEELEGKTVIELKAMVYDESTVIHNAQSVANKAQENIQILDGIIKKKLEIVE